MSISLLSIYIHFNNVINIKNQTITELNNIISIKNQTIIELEEKVNNLTFLCSEKNVYNLIENVTKLKNQVIQLNNTIYSLSRENENLIKDKEYLQSLLAKREEEIQTLNQRISNLENQLRLFMIKVTGYVNITGWTPWDKPVSITFKLGNTRYTVPLTDGARLTYEIQLQNHQTYLVTLQCKNSISQIWWETEPIEWTLEEKQQEEIEKNWDFSTP